MEMKKTILCTLSSLFCISCASGGGGFEVENANPPNVITDNQPAKPSYVNENNGKKLESPAPEDLSEMAWVATTPWGAGGGGDVFVMNSDYEYVKTQNASLAIHALTLIQQIMMFYYLKGIILSLKIIKPIQSLFKLLMKMAKKYGKER
ncbi:hypothetical protein [Avibacterium endocarditidis]|uniref:Lipoprotein n=1 Tax=Avibacterium endocarditidis TaxID=380674 RepID=A0ABX4ZRC2_9PAST|nr:hypothetical protein [Avibacterium endocarditidis]POY41795.1 hypothetical protein C3Z13_09785 [Avibacterium endocarditidis]